jgi:hypothetical protein
MFMFDPKRAAIHLRAIKRPHTVAPAPAPPADSLLVIDVLAEIIRHPQIQPAFDAIAYASCFIRSEAFL